MNSRKFDNRHDWRAVEALPVESRIQREAMTLLVKRPGQFVGCRREGLCRPHLAEGSVQRISVASVSGGAVCVSQEFDLGKVEIDFIFVNEHRQLKEDILKSILETEGGEFPGS